MVPPSHVPLDTRPILRYYYVVRTITRRDISRRCIARTCGRGSVPNENTEGSPEMGIGQGTEGTQETMRAWALRLYPRDWRARYGDEFAALLEDYPLTPYALFDLFLGALDAHLTPFDANGRILRMLNQPRRSVVTVFIAYILFVLAGGSFSNMIEDDVKRLNHAYPALAAAYDVVFVMAFVSLLAVLVGGVP